MTMYSPRTLFRQLCDRFMPEKKRIVALMRHAHALAQGHDPSGLGWGTRSAKVGAFRIVCTAESEHMTGCAFYESLQVSISRGGIPLLDATATWSDGRLTPNFRYLDERTPWSREFLALSCDRPRTTGNLRQATL